MANYKTNYVKAKLHYEFTSKHNLRSKEINAIGCIKTLIGNSMNK